VALTISARVSYKLMGGDELQRAVDDFVLGDVMGGK
jgi:hypothetical protein